MKEVMRNSGPAVAVQRERPRRFIKRTNPRCSVCTGRTWFHAIPLMEPEGVPEPRRSWILCKRCYRALIIEMRRSPVRSPLRLRIAMGLVASERWPQAYPMLRSIGNITSDQGLILFIAWGFVTFMILHLVLIVMLVVLWKN